MQNDAEHVRKFVAGLLRKMDRGEEDDLRKEIEAYVDREVGDLSPMPEGTSGYYYDAELTQMSFKGMEFLRESEDVFDFYIVEIGKDKVVARVAVNIRATAQAHFTFQVRDEGDYIPMGTCDAEEDVEFEAGILLAFEGEFTKEPPEFDLMEVELVDAIESVDFGSVEIDWDTDDRYVE